MSSSTIQVMEVCPTFVTIASGKDKHSKCNTTNFTAEIIRHQRSPEDSCGEVWHLSSGPTHRPGSQKLKLSIHTVIS